jgi:hypothetical protein
LTYLIEYLGEFEFIFETVLGYVSGDQMGYFEFKKTESKISRLGTFKEEGGGVPADFPKMHNIKMLSATKVSGRTKNFHNIISSR